MNVSSRWCVTAFIAFGSLACSDPVPRAAQGAFIVSISGVSLPPMDKRCPVGAAFTYDVPAVRNTKPLEQLDDNTYLHKTIDGEDGATVSCSVKSAAGGFSFSGKIVNGGQALQISDGTLGADGTGTARVFVKSVELSAPLISPSANCVVTTSDVKAGSMWAHFSCPSVESQPADYCKAEGTFVLEHCVQ
jgi:hypothetical protein